MGSALSKSLSSARLNSPVSSMRTPSTASLARSASVMQEPSSSDDAQKSGRVSPGSVSLQVLFTSLHFSLSMNLNFFKNSLLIPIFFRSVKNNYFNRIQYGRTLHSDGHQLIWQENLPQANWPHTKYPLQPLRNPDQPDIGARFIKTNATNCLKRSVLLYWLDCPHLSYIRPVFLL